MSPKAPARRFGVFAHVGNGNLGDEATVAALIQAIRDHRPDAEVWVFSANPPDTEQRHGVRAIPIQRHIARRFRGSSPPADGTHAGGGPGRRSLLASVKARLKAVAWLYRAMKRARGLARFLTTLGPELGFLARSFGALRRIDRLLIAGGGQLGDYFGGPWGYPFALFRWCLLARLAGARVAFVSVGAEPIRSGTSRRLLRWALALADYRSFRDEGSRRLIESIGAGGPHLVRPDLVQGLRLPLPAVTRESRPGLTVGINPIPFFDARYWTEHDDAVYQHYVSTLAAFASWLIERGHRVLFFPTQIHADPPVIRDIELVMKRHAGAGWEERVDAPAVASFDDLSAALARVDVVVASRFHGIIFAFLLDRPVLGLSYYRKTEDLMTGMGQGDYVLAIRTLDLESLIARFGRLELDLATARDGVIRRRSQHADMLEAQYGQVLGSA
jgi:polysaccharide pyruvyl transferase WcaK-like protein